MLSAYTRPTLIEVMAPHCVECRAMQPDLDAVAGEFEAVDLVVLDTARDLETIAKLRVLGTPTLIAVRDGREITRFTGRRTRRELAELFAEIADGDPASISRISQSDRVVWTVGGVALIGLGLLIGPSWLLVAIGVGLAGYANIRRTGSGRRVWSKLTS